jgi:GTP-binding protein
MEIKSAKYIISSPEIEKCPVADKPEYAFIGRSNVGKSSLINMLCSMHNLAKTSGTPGKTQLINHFLINHTWYLVDLPGYGYAKVSQNQRKKWGRMIEDYLRKRSNLGHVFVLIDARHTPQKIDLDFVNSLGEWEVPFSLVFTKADKEKQTVVASNVKKFLEAMREQWQFLPRHFVTSAIKGQGRDKLLTFIAEMNQSWDSSEGNQ